MEIIICSWMKKVENKSFFFLKSFMYVYTGSQSQDEILYCADTPIDSCGYFEGEDPCECGVVTYGDSDHDDESDDEQTDDNFGGKKLLRV